MYRGVRKRFLENVYDFFFWRLAGETLMPLPSLLAQVVWMVSSISSHFFSLWSSNWTMLTEMQTADAVTEAKPWNFVSEVMSMLRIWKLTSAAMLLSCDTVLVNMAWNRNQISSILESKFKKNVSSLKLGLLAWTSTWDSFQKYSQFMLFFADFWDLRQVSSSNVIYIYTNMRKWT